MVNSSLYLKFVDIDECATIHGLCLNGNCVNTLGSFYCTCPLGFDLIPPIHACEGTFSLHCFMRLEGL